MGTVHEEVKRIVNGVDVRKLEETIDEINEDPDRASFSFHAINEWLDGTRNRTVVNKYSGVNTSVELKKPFIMQADEPPTLLGEDSAPNAIMSLLHSLASCLSVTIVYNAAIRGMIIDELTIEMEGDVDIHGFLGLSQEVRPGFQDVRVKIDLKSDSSRREIEDLLRYSQKVSPVLDSLRNRIPVEIVLK